MWQTARYSVEPMTEDDTEVQYLLALDPEAMLLCALMWARADEADDVARVVGVLAPEDFHNVNYGAIYRAIRELHDAHSPTDATSLRSWFSRQGSESPLDPHVTGPLLVTLSTLRAEPGRMIAYADQVLGMSYRRHFHRTADALKHAAEHAPEFDLFEVLVEHGKAQRLAWRRRQALS